MPKPVVRQAVASGPDGAAPKNSDGTAPKAAPFSGPEALVLGALSERPAATSADLERAGASASAARSLEARGLVASEETELDGGRTERLWTLTAAGEELVKTVAPGGRKVSPRLGGVVPWFGAARKAATFFGNQLRGCKWVGVPFCGSLAEVPAILAAGAREVVVNDAHRGLINMIRVMADARAGAALYRRLRRTAFAPITLEEAQTFCRAHEPNWSDGLFGDSERKDAEHAFHYFVCAWGARSANAGTKGELSGKLAVRWDSGGGSSSWRFHGAAWSIREWRKVLTRCAVLCEDGFAFLEKVKDDSKPTERVGVYVDPPWPGAGGAYQHSFGEGAEEETNHRRLAAALHRFRTTRVVLRTGGDPLTRSLYREADGWTWLAVDGRDQANARKCEWAVVRNGGS